MPTLLVNRKMDPALRARIRATLKTSAGAGRRVIDAPRAVAVFRVVTVLSILSLATLLFFVRRRAQQRMDDARATILASLHARGGSLGADDEQTLARVESELQRLAGSYEGDVVSPEVKAAGALDAILSRPTIYVRGVITEFGDAKHVAGASESSSKDTFLACLFSPPTARTEDIVLSHVKAVAETIDVRTSNVVLLRDVEKGAPFLLPPWSARLASASTMQALAQLRYDLDHAPIEEAAKGLRARQLLAVGDEPAVGGGFTELEGDRDHAARVVLIDLASGAPLLRLRRRVDCSWITEARRRKWSLALDGCLLAVDARESAK